MVQFNTKVKIVLLGLSINLLAACGQDSSFSSVQVSKVSSLSAEVEELNEQVLIMDENDVIIDQDKSDDSKSTVKNDSDQDNGVVPVEDGKKRLPLLGANPNLDFLSGFLNGKNESTDGSGCGDRQSHIIKIQGPNGSYVGVGPGNVEVSTNQAYVCVSPNEVLVGIGDLNENLQDVASCSSEASDKNIYICQKTQNNKNAIES